ncbi:TetR family transcriptional regulator [Paenibacillus stellifer]|uniref:TetR family transcriptional regulator n=1 Tax=Paenibacillus stellifer TaxID=169760 RepID=A0A089LRI7_9BACL|nr:TetR/AcrR family transcriptional regulator [Paenibacillus stellifer]AIQ62715.1 TetR family transcriptional regulator [Paenibacillus stellifer]
MAVVDRRQQVLQAAAKSFSFFGYKATTMDQVAKIANVGKGTIYTFFTNKDELFDETVRNVTTEFKRIAAGAIERGKPFFENLLRVLDVLDGFRKEQELYIKLTQEQREFGTPQAQEGLDRFENVILDFIEKEVSEAMERGEIKRCDAKVVSHVLFRLYFTLVSDLNKVREPLSKEEIKSYFRLFLAEGIEIAPSQGV